MERNQELATEPTESPRPAPYKLPNGCFIEVGGKVRVPKEHLNIIPLEDWEKYGLDIVEGEQSYASEVIIRTSAGSGDLTVKPKE